MSDALGRADGLPRARVRPAYGWLNDPHGPVRWQGRWHVFFQHNPDAAEHGGICWGHASSADLVAWVEEPVALRPTPGGLDAFGCWTGCLVVDGETAVIAYTAVADGPESATIALATSSDPDLGSWTKDPTPVAHPPEGPDAPALRAFRDPFLLEVDGRRLAVVGAGGTADGTGAVLLYDASDLRAWRYLGVLLDTTDPVAAQVAPGDVWECPQLFRLDGRWVLVVSLVSEPHRGRVVHLTGDLVADGDAWRLVPLTGGLVDHGHDFYAPAVLAPALPDEGRTLLWGWVTEDRPQAASDAVGWSGALTVVRELALDRDGLLRSSPVAELASRRVAGETVDLDAGGSVALPAGPLDVLLEGEGPVELDLLGEVRLLLDGDRVELRRDAADPYRAAWPTSGTRTTSGPWTVRLLVDASVLEVHVADGPCFTERAYAGGERLAVPSGRARVTVHRTDLDRPVR